MANLALGLGALLVLAGTILAIWTGGMKERYGDQRIAVNEAHTADANAAAAKANERAALLESEVASAKAREAEANGRIAEANAVAETAKSDAAAANLQIQIMKAGRRLVGEDRIALVAKMKTFSGTNST